MLCLRAHSLVRALAITWLACFASALRPSRSALRPASRHVSRSGQLLLQYGTQDLPPGWITDIDEASGTPFYYNELTGESQWEPPHQDARNTYAQEDYKQEEEVQQLPPGWTTDLDKESGMRYYYNDQTGESQWDPPFSAEQGYANPVIWRVVSTKGWGPRFAGTYKLRNGEEEALGRFDMLESIPTRPWVSPEQCLVRIRDDGTALVESLGKPPTGWRSSEGGPWQWLMRDEVQVLSDGDQVSLDYQDPEGTVFVCSWEDATGYPQEEDGQTASRPRRTRRRYDRGPDNY